MRLLRIGLIPAHAGKTAEYERDYRERWAHPRSRGENGATQATDTTGPGSSPLTRGKPPIVGAYTMTGGLIPAHAGKTTDLDDLTSVYRAHPRSRGENTSLRISLASVPGSSPLTRGKPGSVSV